MLNCSAAAVLLIQVHNKIKNYSWWEAINVIEKCEKKPAEGCSFLRSYRVASCSFIKYKTASQVFFHDLQ